MILRLLKTYLRNRTTEDRLNGLTMMYFYATETTEVDRVIDRFAKKRRLLLLLSRSVGMKLKFDRNIIAIIKFLVFKELPPFESSGFVPV